MSEVITIGTGSETILGTHDGAIAHVATMLGDRYDAWTAASPTTQKKSLVNAVRFLNGIVWDEDADTFDERDALEVDGKFPFHEAQYELAVLILEDTAVTDAKDQGSNIRTAYSAGSGVEFFNPTTKNADPLPPILMRLVGGYLGATGAAGPIAGSGQAGSCVNPFSSCRDMDRREPY